MTASTVIRTFASCAIFTILTSIAHATDPIPTTAPATPPASRVFDETRFEVSASLGSGSDSEDGIFLTPSVFFDPLGSEGRKGFDKVFHPRLFLSASISTAGESDQLMGGLSWKFPTIGRGFLDLGLGGALTNANLDDGGSRGPGVGSHALFHEYVTLGVNLDERWSLTATVRHSSNADLAEPNSGLTYGGLGLGRRF